MNNNNAPFAIGQRVVAIENSTPGFGSSYKKGDVFTVDELYLKSRGWNMSFIEKRNGYYHDCSNFAPITESRQRIVYVAETLREAVREVVPETLDTL